VRNPVRKILGVTLVGMLGALFAMPMLAAGAQSDAAPEPPGDCKVLSLTPNPVDAFPQQVTMTGTAPNDVTMALYADGAPATPNGPGDVVSQTVTDNTFTLKYTVTAPTTLSANFTFGDQNAYTAGCPDPLGEVVFRVDVKAASATRPAAQALAFTGSSDTPSYVLIGIAAVVLGAVLLVAARRRSQAS
jgi:LPXTG-motif cell wall-anchored protein